MYGVYWVWDVGCSIVFIYVYIYVVKDVGCTGFMVWNAAVLLWDTAHCTISKKCRK